MATAFFIRVHSWLKTPRLRVNIRFSPATLKHPVRIRGHPSTRGEFTRAETISQTMPRREPIPLSQRGGGASRRGVSAFAALVTRVLSAEVELVLRAPLFTDATGDALVADRAGCAWRMGTESQAETGEWHAAAQASTDTMGNSIYMRAINTGKDAPFTPPPWAARHHDPDFFTNKDDLPATRAAVFGGLKSACRGTPSTTTRPSVLN
jgi:hypothetical protein